MNIRNNSISVGNRMRRLRIPVRMLPGLFVLLILTGPAAPALAHPLGNFSVNRYSRLELHQEKIRIHYIVDMAEIPAFHELGRMDADGDGIISEPERDDYLTAMADRLRHGLALAIDGALLEPEWVTRELTTPPGQAGLRTLRLHLVLEAALPPAKAESWKIDYRDSNYDQRLGWQEIVARGMPGVKLLASNVPRKDRSDELRRYPQDRLAAPLDVRQAAITFAPGGIPAAAKGDSNRTSQVPVGPPNRLAALIAADTLTVPIMLLSLLIAAGLGAMHALSPGHGKAIVGAYLVGSRGTAKQALILGLTVTVTHTAGVFALGLITLGASRYLLPEQIYPWLGCISGLIVAALGAGLLRQRLRRTAQRSAHDHDDMHGHGRHHHHSDGHNPIHHGAKDHMHALPEAAPTLRNLLALGVSGGLLPCPSALVVLLGAIALQRIGFGMLLIVAFSLGLAAALTLVGLVFIHARDLFSRSYRGHGMLKIMPVLSAAVITAAGIGITIQGAWKIFQAGAVSS